MNGGCDEERDAIRGAFDKTLKTAKQVSPTSQTAALGIEDERTETSSRNKDPSPEWTELPPADYPPPLPPNLRPNQSPLS